MKLSSIEIAKKTARKQAAEDQVYSAEVRLNALRQELVDAERELQEEISKVALIPNIAMGLPPREGARYINDVNIVPYHSDSSRSSESVPSRPGSISG